MALELNAVNLVLVAIAGLIAALVGVRVGGRINRWWRHARARRTLEPRPPSVVIRSVAGPNATVGGSPAAAVDAAPAATPIRAFSESDLAWWLHRPGVLDRGAAAGPPSPPGAAIGRSTLRATPPPTVSARVDPRAATAAAGMAANRREAPSVSGPAADIAAAPVSRRILWRDSAAVLLVVGLLLLAASTALPPWLSQGVLTATGAPPDGAIAPGASMPGESGSPPASIDPSGTPAASGEPTGGPESSPAATAPMPSGSSPGPGASPSVGPTTTPTPGPGSTPVPSGTPRPGATPTPTPGPTPPPPTPPPPTPTPPTPTPATTPTPAPTPTPTPTPTVSPTPVADFTWTQFSGQRVRFQATSGLGTSWAWTFGDGTSEPNGRSTQWHVYAAPGSYNVTLVEGYADGSSSAPRTHLITVAP